LILLALAAALWLRRRRAEPATTGIPPIVRYLWWLSLPLVLLAAWILGLAVYGPLTPEWTVRHLAYRASARLRPLGCGHPRSLRRHHGSPPSRGVTRCASPR
jgi:hypothetical protein